MKNKKTNPDPGEKLKTTVCKSGENGGKCNPPYMHEVQKVWNEERGEWVIELTGSSMCTDCLQYECFEWEDLEPDLEPVPLTRKNAPSILDDIKAQGFPDGPEWERYDYKTGGDGLEMPTEYWTNKKTGISYKVEAEAVIEHYAAEVYHSPDPYISTPPEVCKSKIKKEKRTF